MNDQMNARPLLLRQLDALELWLWEASWTPHEVACLIAGVLPPEINELPPEIAKKRNFGASLPGDPCGCPPPEGQRAAWDDWKGKEIARIEAVLSTVPGMGLMKPRDVLQMMAKADYAPPWAAAAREHAGCREYLPQELLNGSGPIKSEPEAPLTLKAAASLGGKAKAEGNTKWQKFGAKIRKEWESGKTGAEIIEPLQIEHGDAAPSQSAIYRRIAQWESEKKIGARKAVQ